MGGIRCPVLAVQGYDDEYGSLAQLESLRRHMPQARLSKPASCGHSPHRDQPQALTPVVVDFVAHHGKAGDAPAAEAKFLSRPAQRRRQPS